MTAELLNEYVLDDDAVTLPATIQRMKPRGRQLPFDDFQVEAKAIIVRLSARGFGSPIPDMPLKSLLSSSTSTRVHDPKSIASEMHNQLRKLGFLEMIHGYIEHKACRFVVVADRLSRDERDRLWDIQWAFVEQYPDLDIDIRLLQRRGRSISDVFQEDRPAFISERLMVA